MGIYLQFTESNMEIDPSDYNTFEEFFQELPRDEDGEISTYSVSNESLDELNSSNDEYNKENLKSLYDAISALNTYDDDKIDIILAGIVFQCNSVELEDFTTTTIHAILDQYYGYFTYEEDAITDYLTNHLQIAKNSVYFLTEYLDTYALKAELFNENDNYYFLQ